MGHHAPQTLLEYVSKGSALRLAVMEKSAHLRSLISVESVEVITRDARRCQVSSQSLCKYSTYCFGHSFSPVHDSIINFTPVL